MSEAKTINPWHYKPWWCQPWSIILTGIVIIVSSWLLWGQAWLTLLFCLPICLWWIYFLVIWPKLIQQTILKQGNYHQPDFLSTLKEE